MTDEPMLDKTQGFPSTSLRGPRGLGIDYAAELENRMPIRQEKLDKIEKLSRRESKLGLRNIFGRSKTAKDDQELSGISIMSKPASFRTTLAEVHEAHLEPQNDLNLPTNFSWKPLPPTAEDLEQEQHEVYETATPRKRKTNSRVSKQTKDSNSSWSLPPLFKAFPQAVRHATLPATSISADAILRINEKKASHQTKEEREAAAGATGSGSAHIAPDKEKAKKKNKRNLNVTMANFDWTSKVYILVTSGYLLQYAGDGDFDRLPEKVLRLGPSSAAFATDAIPGRHWVVQVSSVADVDDLQGQENRSIFSKLSLRLTERRSASNLLMVFESAEDMEGWLAVIRTEIEKQGGKKKLSETGKPKPAGVEPYLREHTSQRTLIVRDPLRFTNARSQPVPSLTSPQTEVRWSQASTRQTSSDTARNQSLDDISSTNSMVSQDERQLENLRENTNRLSFISSGQRTFVTSTLSSPDGSPTRDKFDEGTLSLHEPSARAEVRMRPNASEIATRRESMQVGSPFIDDGVSPNGKTRILPTCATVMHPDRVASPIGAKPTPNFSVPHSSNRRFSYARAPGTSLEGSPIRRRDGDTSPRRFDRIPPTAMQSARRLSVVTDQTVTRAIATDRLPVSPKSPPLPVSPRADTNRRRLRSVSRGRAGRREDDHQSREPNVVPESTPEGRSWRLSPRKHSSTSALRKTTASPVPQAMTSRRPHIASMILQTVPGLDGLPRGHRTSFLDIGESTGEGMPGRSTEHSHAAKRSSTGSLLSEHSIQSYEIHESALSSHRSSDSSATIRSTPKPTSGHYLNVERTPRSSLMNRRSMPQIAVSGPPPAPPPTRALPPIPQKSQMRA